MEMTVVNDMGTRVREKVLVVDDEASVRDVVARGLGRAGYECVQMPDGYQAVRAMQSGGYMAVITDLNMPRMRGDELLSWVKIADPDMPVIVVSGVDDLDAVRGVLKDGAFDYLVKPVDLGGLAESVRRAIDHGRDLRKERSRQDGLRILVEQRTTELERALTEIQSTYDATILALGSALETRDTETQTHCVRVARYTLLLARELGMRDTVTLTNIERGAYLHDIGKIGVPDQILRKKGPLTTQERAIINRHPEIGRRIVAPIGFLAGAAPIVWCHHERPDGLGYPRGLRGNEIPREARLFAVADALDAMISERPYRGPMPLSSARQVIRDEEGRQFDPLAVQALDRIPDTAILEIAKIADGSTGPRPMPDDQDRPGAPPG